jgi:hypothetical protein
VPDAPSRAFSYAIVRIVPRVERGERFNAGVVLYCAELGFLGARVRLDERRLAALAPDVAPEVVRPYLDAVVRIAEGDAAAGPIAALPPGERFGWLAAPSSTMLQPSSVHTGLCDDPAKTLDALFEDVVG